MPRVVPARLASTSLLLALAAFAGACDRTPRAPAKPAAAGSPASTASIQAGAVSAPMAPATVALSGAIRDLPPATTPDAIAPPARGAGGAIVPPAAAVRPPPPMDLQPRTASPPESAAMRAFRAEQERRDRELLERDLREAREGVALGEPSRAAPPSGRYEPAPPREDDRYRDDDRVEDRYRDEDPPLDDPSYDEAPPPEDAPWNDEDAPPAEDDELHWDPATGTWR